MGNIPKMYRKKYALITVFALLPSVCNVIRLEIPIVRHTRQIQH